MAEAMPGIAGLLPQTAAQAPSGPAEEMTPENLAAFERMRQEIPPSEFSEELLSAASEADPLAVAEFKTELRDAQLPPEALDVLNQLVDEVLAAPERYPEIRAKYLAQGIPEDLLPPSFDPEFFGALNLAVDEIRATSGSPLPPQGFAGGGLATLNPIAAAMSQEGRYGDTMLAHISPPEARMLRQMGGSGTINPSTGLPEFWNPFEALKKVFSKVARAVKKFIRSKVGRIITTLALAFFLGPAAANAMGVGSTVGVAAVSGFIGTAGSSLLAGDDLKTSLKAGVIGGIAGGATAGIFGGAEAFQAGSYTGPTTIAGQWEKARSFFTGGAQPVVEPVGTLDTALPDVGGGARAYPATNTGAGITRTPITGADAVAGQVNLGDLSGQTAPNVGFKLPDVTAGLDMGPLGGAQTAGTISPLDQNMVSRVSQLSRDASGVGYTPSGGFDPRTVANVPVPEQTGFMGKVMDKVMPGRIEQSYADNAFAKVAAQFDNLSAKQVQANLLSSSPSPILQAAWETAKKPGMIQKWGPMAGILGVGMGLAGGFEGEEMELPPGAEDIMGTPGMDLLQKYPEKYGLQYGGTYSMPIPPMYNPYHYQPPSPPPANVARGGSMEKYQDKNGAINGKGTGTSDDIPAMLSDGEFVFTAKAVRNMGNGSRRQGAKRMYALMKKLEDRAHG